MIEQNENRLTLKKCGICWLELNFTIGVHDVRDIVSINRILKLLPLNYNMADGFRKEVKLINFQKSNSLI